MTEDAQETTYLVDENGEIVGEEIAEPDTDPLTPDDEPDEPLIQEDEDDDEDDEPEGYEPGVAEAALYTERELEVIGRKLDLDKAAHRRKLEGILGDDLGGHIPCPTCMDGVDGFIMPPDIAPLNPEQRERMLQVLGLDQWGDIPTVEWAQPCEDCNGHGEVRTGSKKAGMETTRCLTCGGDGWKNLKGAAGNVHELPTIPSETGPTVYGQEPSNDPDVQALRARGFTVFPPVQINAG